MATKSEAIGSGVSRSSAEEATQFDVELAEAVADFERGDFVVLDEAQLEKWIATGESPWGESRG